MSANRYGGNSDVGRNVSKSDDLDMPMAGNRQIGVGTGLAGVGGYQLVRAHRLPSTYKSKIAGFDQGISDARARLKSPGVKGIRNKMRVRADSMQQITSNRYSRRIWQNALNNVKPRQAALRRAGLGIAATGVGLAALGAQRNKIQRKAGVM